MNATPKSWYSVIQSMLSEDTAEYTKLSTTCMKKCQYIFTNDRNLTQSLYINSTRVAFTCKVGQLKLTTHCVSAIH